MSDFKTIIEKLSEPFAPEKIKWRVGSRTKEKAKGMVLAYLDARDVMERLDEVVGSENWQNKLIPTPDGMICELGIRYIQAVPEEVGGDHFESEWIWKSNSAGETAVEEVKGAGSDAFKRAGVLFGIGRYLYDLPNQWVELENGYLPKKFKGTLPDWALPKTEEPEIATVKSADGQSVAKVPVRKPKAKKEESPLASKQVIDIFLKDLKALNEEDRAAFKIWLKEEGLTFGKGSEGWNLRDSDLERVATKISEFIEPIE